MAVDFNADVVINVGGSQTAPADTERPEPDDSERIEGNETDREDS